MSNLFVLGQAYRAIKLSDNFMCVIVYQKRID